MKLKRRFGKFRVSGQMLSQQFEGSMTRLMGACIITRAVHHWISDEIEYAGYSFRFREIAEGEIIPEYDVVFSQDGDLQFIERATPCQ